MNPENLLAYLDDSALGTFGGLDSLPVSACVDRSDSALSNLSNASTAPFSARDRQDPRETLLVKAFCVPSGTLVDMPFPLSAHGWIYRYEMCGHTQLRWDLQNTPVVLIAKHNTCMKSAFQRSACRNCIMKAIWRRECIDPDDIFFLFFPAEHTQQLAPVLNMFVLNTHDVSPKHIVAYSKSVPKTALSRKRTLDDDSQRAQMLKVEAMLVLRLSALQMRDDAMLPNAIEEQGAASLFDMLGDALGVGISLPYEYTSAHVTVPAVAVSASEALATVASGAGQPNSPILATPVRGDAVNPKADTTTRSTTPSLPLLPMPDSQLAQAYNALIDRLVDYDARMCVKLSLTSVDDILSKYSDIYALVPRNESSQSLTHLLRIMGITGDAGLMLKSIFPTWLARVRNRMKDERTTVVRLGLYTAPSVSIFTEMCNLNTIPGFIASGKHRIDSDTRRVQANLPPQVRPILVACIGADGLVCGNEMLPLACVSLD